MANIVNSVIKPFKLTFKSLLKLETALKICCVLFILIGIVARLAAYFYNRSLFLDEAMLASSVVQRDYLGLFQPLDYIQAAPLGFMLITKTFVYLFGTSEYILRLLPLLSGLGSIAIFYLIVKDVFKDPRPYIGTAFFATISFLLYYSIEFKPYMFDGFITLVILYTFISAQNGKVRYWVYILVGSLLIWFSFPSVFTLMACCAIWFIKIISGRFTLKDYKIPVITSLFFGSSLLFLLLTYYNNIHDSSLHPYWNQFYFPLIPSGIEDLKLIYRIVENYFSIFGRDWAFILIISLVALGFVLKSKEKRWFGQLIVIEVILLIVASGLKRYALIDRILLFMIPLHALLIALFISGLWSKWPKLALITSFIIIFSNLNFYKFLISKHVFRQTMEINPLLAHIEKTGIHAPLYLSSYAVPQYLYKTGYSRHDNIYPKSTKSIKAVIFGTSYFKYNYKVPYSWHSDIDSTKLAGEASSIICYPKVYLIFVLCSDTIRNVLLDRLSQTGTIMEVKNIYKTPLYCYSRKI